MTTTNYILYTVINPGRLQDYKEGRPTGPWVYTNITTNLSRTIRQHQTGKGSRRTRGAHEQQWSLYFYVTGLTGHRARSLEYNLTTSDRQGTNPGHRLFRYKMATRFPSMDASQPKLTMVHFLSDEW